MGSSVKNTNGEKSKRPSPETKAEWKKKYGTVKVFTDKEADMVLIVRQPGIKELEKAVAAKNKTGANPYDFSRSVLADCTLYMDEGFMNDDKRALAAYGIVDEFNITVDLAVEEL